VEETDAWMSSSRIRQDEQRRIGSAHRFGLRANVEAFKRGLYLCIGQAENGVHLVEHVSVVPRHIFQPKAKVGVIAWRARFIGGENIYRRSENAHGEAAERMGFRLHHWPIVRLQVGSQREREARIKSLI